MAKKSFNQIFGERLKRIRLDQSGPRGGNFSPEKLGALMDVSGQTIRNWESGATQPDLESIQRLAKVLKTTAGFIAFGERAPEMADLTKYAPADEVPAGAYETIEDRDKRLAAKAKALESKRA